MNSIKKTSLTLAVLAVTLVVCISAVPMDESDAEMTVSDVTYIGNSQGGMFYLQVNSDLAGEAIVVTINSSADQYRGVADESGNVICEPNGNVTPLTSTSSQGLDVEISAFRQNVVRENVIIRSISFDMNGGSGSIAVDTIYATAGAEVNLPDVDWVLNGQEFRGWSEDKSSTVAELAPGEYIVPDRNVEFYAVYGPGEEPVQNYKVTFNQPANGSLTVVYDEQAIMSGTEVPVGAVLTITATADEGYELESLTVNEDPFTNGGTYIVNRDVTIAATFTETGGPGPDPEPEYDVTVVVNDSSMGTASANHVRAEAGTTVTLTATPENGFRFVKWTSNDVTITGDSFVMPDHNVTVTAVFEEIPPTEYTVTVIQADHGTASASSTSATAGTLITLTANPDDGYVLDYWVINGENVYRDTFTMPEDNVTVTPVFRLLETYEVTIDISGDGSVYRENTELTDDDVISVRELDDLVLTYTAGEDNYTVRCSVSDENARVHNSNGTVTVSGIAGNCTVSIEFVQGYMVTVTEGDHGEVVPGTGLQVENTTVTYTIRPDAGYAVDRVLVDGQEVEVVDNEFQVQIGTSTHTVTVEYVYVGVIDDDDDYVPPDITVVTGDDDDSTTYIVAIAAAAVVAILAALILMQTRKS